ncbi:beta-fructofuranosidase, insoluble isoenzyme 7 [Brachypodium distachyon]|nr:beta-fructofuranosidase, insoluble isoenzyme 7 [Brachypodium distachyon]|eukprot:XP_003575546.4 beta-fructofuranosidase, insoluble isoenzyme 7 [Brachypodium distachyon]
MDGTKNPQHGRTAYHFQPAKNWQNDPNGPMYHNGMYHLFYQYNPHGPTWDAGKLSWGHSVSGDLVNWAALDNALDPTSPFDANGCWSGSATVLPGGRPAILYTGIDADRVQVQNVAFASNPSDPLLRDWHKPSCNPVIGIPADVTGNNFRDPTEPWRGSDGLWRVAVAAEVEGKGTLLVYRSADFLRWERNPGPPLHASSPAVPVLECPDLFPISMAAAAEQEGLDALMAAGGSSSGGVTHVLKLTDFAKEDHYMVGRYDELAGDTFAPAEPERGDDPGRWRRLDHGHLYASKSFFDARKKRRVLWAWVDENDGAAEAKGWAGIQAFPRAMWLDGDGKGLVQWPVEEIETLRRKRDSGFGPEGTEVGAGGKVEIGAGIQSSQADVEVVFEIPSLEEAETLDDLEWALDDPQRLCAEKGAFVHGGVGPFGLLVLASGGLQEHTAVFFRVFRHQGKYKVLMCTDLTRSSTKAGVNKPCYGAFLDVDVEKDRSISLRTLIDHTVVESFGNGGRTCMTARVYPEHAAKGRSRTYVFNHGAGAVKVSKLEAWELAAAAVNGAGGGGGSVAPDVATVWSDFVI